MKLTKQRKIFASILGLAAVAFLGDRILRQPDGPGSAPDAAPPAEKVEPSHLASNKPEKAEGGKSLAVRLSEIPASDAATTRDPFRKGWKPSGPAVSSANPKSKVAIAETPADFVAGHHLTGVSSPRSGIRSAVLDKKAYKIGDQVDGWRVASIDGSSGTKDDYKPAKVMLERGSQRVTMELQTLASADNRKGD